MAEPTKGGGRGRLLSSVRARATLTGAAIVLVTLAVGSVLFALLLERTLVDAESSTAEAQAESIADDVEAGGAAVLPDLDDAEVQIVVDGVVLDGGADDELPALPVTDEPARATVDGEAAIVAAAEAELDGRDAHVVVARSLEDVGEAVGAAAGLLAVAVPAVTIVVAALLWVLVGRALRPVDRIRADVDAIQAASLERRIESPATGDEIERLAETMNRLLDRLDTAQRSQRRFVSDASHELRSPVATLRQYADLVAAHPDAVAPGELADIVALESTRMAELVDSLLLLARADERRAAASEQVDLDDLLLAEATRLRALGGVEVDAGGVTAVRVIGDRPLLARVVRNLVDNAARHAAGRVGLSLGVDGPHAVLRVDDDGGGIPESERVRVFERFVRLDESRSRDIGGAGLGLAIVAEVAALHGGAVTALAAPSGGARLELRLPLART